MYISFQYQVKTEPVLATPETVTEDRWHQPWSEPVRQKINPTLAVALIVSGATFLSPTAGETVTLDKYYTNFAEPVRIKPGLPTPEQTFLWALEKPEDQTLESKWHFPWSEPVRLPPRLITGAQQTWAYGTFNPVYTFSYYLPLNEPVRLKPGLGAHLQQFAVTDTNFIPNPANIIEGWFNWYSEPVRMKPGLSASLQQFLAYHPRMLPTPNVTATLSAFEINSDTALMAINVVRFNTPASAQVSLVEIGGASATSVIESS